METEKEINGKENWQMRCGEFRVRANIVETFTKKKPQIELLRKGIST